MEPNHIKEGASLEAPTTPLNREGASLEALQFPQNPEGASAAEAEAPPNPIPTPEPQSGASLEAPLTKLSLRAKNRSGAEKKRARRAREAAAVAAKGGSSGTPNAATAGTPGSIAPGSSGKLVPTVKGKRQLPAGETPPELRQVAKKAKGAILRPTSYSSAVEPELRVAIVRSGYPSSELSAEVCADIQQSIGRALCEIPLGSFTPRFHESYLREGALLVTCTDTQTKEWLRGALTSLPALEKLSLELVERGDLFKLHKCTAWIPGRPEETKVVLTWLSRLNPELRTDRWRVWSRREDAPKGIHLTLGVDEASLKALTSVDFKPFYGMFRASFKLAQNPKEGDKPKGDRIT